ncbi:UNVERIFIED_CONTAM: hypothetical protein FKN15_070047 [Acipenser sinensis]
MADEEAEQDHSTEIGSADAIRALRERLQELATELTESREPALNSASQYCQKFCQTLVEYAGRWKISEDPLPLVQVYMVAILSYAQARHQLSSECDNVEDVGLAVCIELCIQALRMESSENPSIKATICKTISCLLPDDLEVKRACQLTEFLLEPTVESYYAVETLYNEPDQKFEVDNLPVDQKLEVDNLPVPNSLRCELLLVFKTQWPFDPEFWDWKTLKRHCLELMGEEASIVSSIDELNDSEAFELLKDDNGGKVQVEEFGGLADCLYDTPNVLNEMADEKQKKREIKKLREKGFISARFRNWQAYMQYCVLCDKEFLGHRIVRHAQKHVKDGVYSCPICGENFDQKELFVPHVTSHVKQSCKERLAAMKQSRTLGKPTKLPNSNTAHQKVKVAADKLDNRPKKKNSPHSHDIVVFNDKDASEDDGKGQCSKPDLSVHRVEYREEYTCPVTNCRKGFKYFKNLIAHTAHKLLLEDGNSELQMLCAVAQESGVWTNSALQCILSKEAPQEETEVDCKDALEMICNLESDGDEKAALSLCTAFLTRQLLQGDMYCAWELTLFWSKLQQRTEPSTQVFLDHCRQLSQLSKTVYHIFFLIKVIQSEVEDVGLAVCIELCIQALRMESSENPSIKATICKTISCLLPDDLEVKRACQLTEFLLEPTVESYYAVETLYNEPDQKFEVDNLPVPNSLRCELLLVFKTQWPFDPEFWDWKTLKRHCLELMGEEASIVSSIDELNDSEAFELLKDDNGGKVQVEEFGGLADCLYDTPNVLNEMADEKQKKREIKKLREKGFISARFRNWQAYMQYCVLCDKEFLGHRIVRHAQKHVKDGVYSCPICGENFDQKELFVPHVTSHVKQSCKERLAAMKQSRTLGKPTKLPNSNTALQKVKAADKPDNRPKKKNSPHSHDIVVFNDKDASEDDGKGQCSKPDLSVHRVEYREEYTCPVTNCRKGFKYFKNLIAHVRGHKNSEEAKRFLEMQSKKVRSHCKPFDETETSAALQQDGSSSFITNQFNSSVLNVQQQQLSANLNPTVSFKDRADLSLAIGNHPAEFLPSAIFPQVNGAVCNPNEGEQNSDVIKQALETAGLPNLFETPGILQQAFQNPCGPYQTSAHMPRIILFFEERVLLGFDGLLQESCFLQLKMLSWEFYEPLPVQHPDSTVTNEAPPLESHSKPFVCENEGCPYSAMTKDALYKHYYKVHNYTEDMMNEIRQIQLKFAPFRCHICNKTFTRNSNLKAHFQTVHRLTQNKMVQLKIKRPYSKKSRPEKTATNKRPCMADGQQQEFGPEPAESTLALEKLKPTEGNSEQGMHPAVKESFKVTPTQVSCSLQDAPNGQTSENVSNSVLEQPTSGQPTVGLSAAQQPSAEYPTVDLPLAEQPAAQPPTVGQSVAGQPPVGLPVMIQSVAEPPVTTQSLAEPPVMTQSLAEPPVTTQSVAGPPVTTQSLAAPPVTTQSLAEPPVTTQSLAEPPATTQSLAGPPVTTRSPAEPPVTTRSPAELPVMTQSLAELPVMTQSLAEPPVMTQSPAETPVMTQSLAEPPVMTRSPPGPPATTQSLAGPPVTTRSPAELPVMTQSLAELPVMTQSLAELPVMTQSLAELPVMTQSLAELPVMTQSLAELPVMTQSLAELPVMTQSLAELPVMTQSLAEPPVTTQSLAEPPVTTQSLAEPPVTTQSLAEPPATTQSLAEPPATTQSLAEPPATTQSLAEPPATTQSLAEPPATTQSLAEPPATTQSLAEPPATTQSLAEPPATTQSLAEPPVTTQSLAEPPVTTQSLAEPPVTTQSLAEPPVTTQSLAEPPVTTQSLAEPPVTTQSLAEPPVTTQSLAEPPVTTQSLAEPPVTTQSLAEPPVTTRSLAEPPVTTRSLAEPPVTTRSLAEPPVTTRSLAEPPVTTRSFLLQQGSDFIICKERSRPLKKSKSTGDREKSQEDQSENSEEDLADAYPELHETGSLRLTSEKDKVAEYTKPFKKKRSANECSEPKLVWRRKRTIRQAFPDSIPLIKRKRGRPPLKRKRKEAVQIRIKNRRVRKLKPELCNPSNPCSGSESATSSCTVPVQKEQQHNNIDLSTFKPMGFEVSFLKFLEESADQTKRKAKENPLPEIASKRKKYFPLKCGSLDCSESDLHIRTSGYHNLIDFQNPLNLQSVKNVKIILDRTFSEGAELLLKQLQEMRPTVVLEKW